MTLPELIKNIEKDSIEVDFGRAFLDFQNPKEYLIESLEEQMEMYLPDTEEQKSLFKKIFGNKDSNEIQIIKNNAITFGVANYLKLYSYITSCELYICMENDKIVFRQFDHSKDYPIGERAMVEPKIEVDIKSPLKTSIEVPSKKLILTNFFPNNISPDMENQYASYNSLNGIIGRRNHARHYEKHGVLYGQTGNMGLIIWINPSKTEIIITDCDWATYVELYGGSIEDFDSEKEYNDWINKFDKDRLSSVKYLKDGNFEKVGEISCNVWRFEATDYERGKEVIELQKQNDHRFRDIVIANIAGTKVSMEHYYDSIEKSPISNSIVSRILVE
jgi:hypothetical protein